MLHNDRNRNFIATSKKIVNSLDFQKKRIKMKEKRRRKRMGKKLKKTQNCVGREVEVDGQG